jgi:hypothetical protein
MWRCDVGRVVPTFQETVTPSYSTLRQSKTEVLPSSDMSEATHPTIQCNIHEDLNLHEYRCDNLVRSNLISVYEPTN